LFPTAWLFHEEIGMLVDGRELSAAAAAAATSSATAALSGI